MKYEIEFIGIKDETSKDADAVCFRYFDENQQRFIIGIYDGGTKSYGEALKNHLIQYYSEDGQNPIIDFVVCSHSDLDHASGLSVILENFEVKKIFMNRPWLYVEDVFDKVNDGRITKLSLEDRLRKSYSYINDLENLALEKEVEINESFEGIKISDKLTILSPSKEFFLELLIESQKTPLSEECQVSESFISKIKTTIRMALESWSNELIREDVKTSAENEMSIVVWGDMEKDKLILMGDAGLRGINKAIDYAETLGIDVKEANFLQIPHHGGRHNVSPSLLNRLIGNIKKDNETPTKTAFVSVGKNSEHPKKMVVNAFIRRGVKVFEARTSTKRHYSNMPEREGWSSAISNQFSNEVEDWDNN